MKTKLPGCVALNSAKLSVDVLIQ